MSAPQAYVERTPLPSFARAVRTVWVQHTGPGLYVQRNLPTGGAEIQCRVGSVPRLVGPLTAARIELLPAGSTVVGVRFRAGAAAALLGVPADELVDQVVPLDDVWGDRAVRLGELVTSAASSSGRGRHRRPPEPAGDTPGRDDPPRPTRRDGGPSPHAVGDGGHRCAHQGARHLHEPAPAALPVRRRCRSQDVSNARCASRATSPSPRPPPRTTAPAEAGWRTSPRLSGTP